MISIFASGPAAPGLIASVPNNFSEEKIADVSEDNKWRCLKEGGQWLENVDPIHLVLASGKLVLKIKLLMNSLQHQQTDRDVQEKLSSKRSRKKLESEQMKLMEGENLLLFKTMSSSSKDPPPQLNLVFCSSVSEQQQY